MKYLLRAVKYFLSLAVLFCLIIAALVAVKMVDADLSTMFRNGTDSLVQIAVIGAVFALIYPRFGYCERTVAVFGSIAENLADISEIMKVRGYVLESKDDTKAVFHKSFLLTRIMRLGEDKITITSDVRGLSVEGATKDVVRIITAIETRFNENN